MTSSCYPYSENLTLFFVNPTADLNPVPAQASQTLSQQSQLPTTLEVPSQSQMQSRVTTRHQKELTRTPEPVQSQAKTPASIITIMEITRKKASWIMSQTPSAINQIISSLVHPKAVLMWAIEDLIGGFKTDYFVFSGGRYRGSQAKGAKRGSKKASCDARQKNKETVS